MPRKNKRRKQDYTRRLSFNPDKYITPGLTTQGLTSQELAKRSLQVVRGEIWFADLGNYDNKYIEPCSYLTDEQVIEHAISASNGEKFKDFMDGKWKDYFDNQSDADMSFVSMLGINTPPLWGGHANTSEASWLFRYPAREAGRAERHEGQVKLVYLAQVLNFEDEIVLHQKCTKIQTAPEPSILAHFGVEGAGITTFPARGIFILIH